MKPGNGRSEGLRLTTDERDRLDSTRSSTSLDTGSSLNPRTARRLVTASYTSMMIASLPPAFRFVQTHAVVSFGPNPTSGQYSQWPGTQRKTSPSPPTLQTDGHH